MKQFWIMFAISAMQSAGMGFRMQDTDNTGNDDMAGSLLTVGATALTAFVRGDIKGFRAALKAIADSIYAFLEEGSVPKDDE